MSRLSGLPPPPVITKVNIQETDVNLNNIRKYNTHFFDSFHTFLSFFFSYQLQPSTAPSTTVPQPQVTIEKMSPEVIAAYVQQQSPPHLKRKHTAVLGHPPPADVSVVSILIIKSQLHTPCNL